MKKYPIFLREETAHGNVMFPCAVYNENSDPDFPERIRLHWHDEMEIIYVREGHATLQVDEDYYEISKGMIAVVPTNHVHMAVSDAGNQFDFTAIVFHPDLIASCNNDRIQQDYIDRLMNWNLSFPIVIEENEDENWKKEMIHKVCNIIQYYEAGNIGYELAMKIELLSVAYSILMHATEEVTEEVSGHSEYRVELIKKMITYMNDHYDSQLTLADLAEEFHMSKEHLCRFFKNMTKTTPIDYMNYYRIKVSADILVRENCDIGEIAARMGFNNTNYYTRTFRKYMHMTPTAYRHAHSAMRG